MAITVIKTPQRFAPTGNPILFTLTSSRSTIVYFDAVLTELTTGAIIGVEKYYVRPDYPTGVNIDISKMLNSYVNGEFKPYTNGFVDFFSKQTIRYNLKITERYVSGSSIASGDIQNFSGTAMRGNLDAMTMYSYNANHYILDSIPQIYFLTTKPNRTVVNDSSEEGLYFLQSFSMGLQVVYEFYSTAGWYLGSYGHFITTGLDTYNLWRINCSPSYLKSHVPGIDFSNLGHYTVRLADPAFFSKSETRTFVYRPLDCGLTPVNIYWENKFGCIDTYQFVNPEMNQNSNRSMFVRNPYRMNEVGEYANYSKFSNYSVFNVIDQILDATPETTMKVWTKSMSDAECKWMSSLFLSRNYWIKAEGQLYVPLLLQDTNWNMQINRFLREPNVKSLTFKFRDEYAVDYKLTSGPTTSPKPGGGGSDPADPDEPPTSIEGGFSPA